MVRSTDQTPGACGPGSMTVVWWKVWWAANPSALVRTPSATPATPSGTHTWPTDILRSTHRSQNEPASLKNRSSDETRARLNHRNSPTAELAWRQGRGGPFSAATPEAGWITQTKLAQSTKKYPAPHPPSRPGRPRPPAPDSEGPLHGSSAGARANDKMRGSWRRSRTTPHGKGGNWGLEGGRASPGCIPIDDMSPHHHHHTSFPLIGPPPPFPLFGFVVNQIPCTLLDRLSSPVRRHVVVTGGIFFACQ